MHVHPIYTQASDCQDCYRCIRECAVKAIRVENHIASIMQEQCIYCGHCTKVCPAGAKIVRDDIGLAKLLIRQQPKVILSLAPSYVAEFPEYSPEVLVKALHLLGFHAVSETALGAAQVSRFTQGFMADKTSGVYISPCCPSVVALIDQYYPHHRNKIIPVYSPMEAHARMLKQHYGPTAKVVFAGPCIAKKHEADTLGGSAVDAVITFSRLRAWLEEQHLGPDIPAGPYYHFRPQRAGHSAFYPVDGGMGEDVARNMPQSNITFMAFSGIENVLQTLNGLSTMDKSTPVLLELLACSGGCINGPGNTHEASLAGKRLAVVKNTREGESQGPILAAGTLAHFYGEKGKRPKKHYDEPALKETLAAMGKFEQKDELNCGGCGYDTCRDLAQAINAGLAEKEMCLSYMRTLAQEKAQLLLQRMPYGVVMVDEKLIISDCNENFAGMFGRQNQDKDALKSGSLEDLIPFSQYFYDLLISGENSLQKDIRADGNFYHLTIFSLQPFKLVVGIIRNLQSPGLMREEAINRTQEVIWKNLETVQKVAHLLGENAAETENILNSVVQMHQNKAVEDA